MATLISVIQTNFYTISLQQIHSVLYTNLSVKNWSIDLIKSGLKINNKTYTAIYTFVETEIIVLYLLGQKLNIITSKAKL